MSLALFMDEHIKFAVTLGLRGRKVDVLTAQEDGSDGLPDADLLDRATALNRLLVTHDEDFLAEAAKRQVAQKHFRGIVFGEQQELRIGKMIDDLELVAHCFEYTDVADQVVFLPLR